MLWKTIILFQLLLASSSILAYPTEQAHFGSPVSPNNHLSQELSYVDEEGHWRDGVREYIEQNNMQYELVRRPAFPEHQLRITEPTLCDPTVQQYSGYFDIAADKHLFFWFFESRNSPSTDPLILWLNGGPGSSSAYGLLIELGPCNIADKGQNTTRNPFSWNTNANIIFLEQPVNVGYSYVDGNTSVNNSAIAAQDVYAFLQLFNARFPEYSTAPFHIAGESYGGTYVPNIARVVHQQNKALATYPGSSSLKHINLDSIILANGLTDPYIQLGSMADYVCNGPYPIFQSDSEECVTLRTRTIPACQSFITACYQDGTPAACGPAMQYCFSQVFEILEKPDYHLNPYDARKKCDRSPDKDGPTCYPQVRYIETYLNNAEVKKALGVNPDLQYLSANESVFEAFVTEGDGVKNSALLLPELVDEGIRLLVYAGDADMFSNFIGQERWVEALQTKFTNEFAHAKTLTWKTLGSKRSSGTVRSAGPAGNVTLVRMFEAGHLAPFDQPEAALDLITRWIAKKSLSS